MVVNPSPTSIDRISRSISGISKVNRVTSVEKRGEEEQTEKA
jgi:hypothetical protein